MGFFAPPFVVTFTKKGLYYRMHGHLTNAIPFNCPRGLCMTPLNIMQYYAPMQFSFEDFFLTKTKIANEIIVYTLKL